MRLTLDKEKDMLRLRMMKDMIAEQQLHEKLCPVLLTQLTELEVFARKLVDLIDRVREDCEEAS